LKTCSIIVINLLFPDPLDVKKWGYDPPAPMGAPPLPINQFGKGLLFSTP